ncbi:MFS general substrate transporter [Teratosphaeria nubilosa]|uniref:MFS general substrate transporter n=1 Tax=Teratosphaeria nubilosa TaxID=161662 RepID=A0A6G1L6I6_9PEZI|nr:MFS general substrate transporter [Teratosphaeria nubilosa]
MGRSCEASEAAIKPDAVEILALSKTPASTSKEQHDVVLSSATQDGGTRAWLQVLGSFLVFGNLWGFTFAFGSFQTYYQLSYLSNDSASDISWIGTIAAFFLVIGGVVSGPLFDLGYFRAMLLTGSLAATFALFMLSLCTRYYQILLAQGVLTGLATGLLYLPGLALVGRSFKKHRSIAMSITTCGAPVGGVIYTLMFQQLIGPLGFAWTIRAMAFFMLGSYLMAYPLLLYRAHNIGDLASGHARKLFDPTALKDALFWTYSISNFLVFLGYIVPFVYIAAYDESHLRKSQASALNMIIIAQATSVVGRLLSGYAASRIGVMIPWITCAMCSGILCLAWIGVTGQGGLIAISALFGCFSGALIPLPPSIFPTVCPDPTALGTRLGMAQAIGSFASLISGPIAGALTGLNAGLDGYDWRNLQLYTGLVMIGGGCSLIGLWLLLQRKRGTGKLV